MSRRLQLTVGNALRLIEFLGKMLGKAMYEGERRGCGEGRWASAPPPGLVRGTHAAPRPATSTPFHPLPSTGILVELPLAPFFLKKFRGAYCDINDLPTLDPELYRSVAGVCGPAAFPARLPSVLSLLCCCGPVVVAVGTVRRSISCLAPPMPQQPRFPQALHGERDRPEPVIHCDKQRAWSCT